MSCRFLRLGPWCCHCLRLKERHQSIISRNDAVVAEIEAADEAAAAFQGAGSSVQSGTWEARQKSQPVQKVQFFIKGKVATSTSIVRGGLQETLSHVIGTDGLDVHAMVYGRMVDMRSTLSSVGIVGGCTVYIHLRLRGGSREDVPGQWKCSQCFAPRCWPVRKKVLPVWSSNGMAAYLFERA